MSSAADELEALALTLPRAERARLAERLLASLDEETEIEEAWRQEVEQRLRAYREGQIENFSASRILEEARERLDG